MNKCNLDSIRLEGNTYLSDSPQLNEDRDDSKFIGGVMGADGPSKRFEAHGHEILQPEVVWSRKAEADESKQLNQCHMLINKMPVTNSVVVFKTREVRRAELDVLLIED